MTSLLELGCGGCVHLHLEDGVEPNCWINSGRGIPKPCPDRLNFDEARSLKAELRALGAKFKHDADIKLENQRRLTEERDTLKEQTEKYNQETQLKRDERRLNDYDDVTRRLTKRVEAAEAEVKTLKEQVAGLEELNRGLDYCAEQEEVKRKDAESRVAEAGKLPEKWRTEALGYPHSSEGLHCKVAVELCADELEKALRGAG
jgi:small-conductance mechanosensitive channel